jgi:hypothetical protein
MDSGVRAGMGGSSSVPRNAKVSAISSLAAPPRRWGAAGFYQLQAVHRLIGKGFRLGLHGHQHKAGAQSRYVYLSSSAEIFKLIASS